MLATGLASLWWWSGRERSLAQTLAVAQRWLPAGMQLEVENAQGSLRFGGEIDRLRISNQRFTLQIKNLTLAWNLGQLLQRRLAVERLHAARVDYRAQPEAPPDDTPASPCAACSCPWPLTCRCRSTPSPGPTAPAPSLNTWLPPTATTAINTACN